jgi:hypothetical protein
LTAILTGRAKTQAVRARWAAWLDWRANVMFFGLVWRLLRLEKGKGLSSVGIHADFSHGLLESDSPRLEDPDTSRARRRAAMGRTDAPSRSILHGDQA